MDGKTALLHLMMSLDMKPATPGTWDSLEVLYMKPTYYCPGFDKVPRTALGELSNLLLVTNIHDIDTLNTSVCDAIHAVEDRTS